MQASSSLDDADWPGSPNSYYHPLLLVLEFYKYYACPISVCCVRIVIVVTISTFTFVIALLGISQLADAGFSASPRTQSRLAAEMMARPLDSCPSYWGLVGNKGINIYTYVYIYVYMYTYMYILMQNIILDYVI